MKALPIGIACMAVASVMAVAQKPAIPGGWAQVSSSTPAVSLYLPGGWKWSDLTMTGGASFGSTVMMIQAWVPTKKNAPSDRVMVTGSPASGEPIGEEGLTAYVASLQRVISAGKVVKQAVVDVAGEKGYMVHMQIPSQGDSSDKPRMVDQYTYLVPGKKYDFHVTYTFNSGTSRAEELQQKSIATFAMKS